MTPKICDLSFLKKYAIDLVYCIYMGTLDLTLSFRLHTVGENIIATIKIAK